jgi:hypothetical protein
MTTKTILVCGVICAALLNSCASNPKRAALTALGAGAGAAIGHAASDGDIAITAASAVVGGAVADGLQGRDDATYQEGVNDGYAQAVSDEAKRKFWRQQHANARPGSGVASERTVYYMFDESGKTTPDGRQLPAGTEIAVPITEPVPVR